MALIEVWTGFHCGHSCILALVAQHTRPCNLGLVVTLAASVDKIMLSSHMRPVGGVACTDAQLPALVEATWPFTLLRTHVALTLASVMSDQQSIFGVKVGNLAWSTCMDGFH